jgi:hypothetical protein
MALSKNYLQLEFGSGHFFDYSKEEKDGYVKHVSTKGNTSYRKYYKDGVEGVLDSISIYDGKFGQQISISLKKEDEIFYLPVAIYDQKGQVDNTYAESLIKLLPKLEKGQNLTVQGYNFKPEDSPYSKIGFSIKASGEKLKSDITNSYYKDGELVPGDVPAIVWVEKLGKKKPSAASIEAKDAYLLGLLETEEKRLTWKKDEAADTDNAAPASKPEPAKAAPKAVPTATAEQAFEQAPPSTSDEDDDDLPF